MLIKSAQWTVFIQTPRHPISIVTIIIRSQKSLIKSSYDKVIRWSNNQIIKLPNDQIIRWSNYRYDQTKMPIIWVWSELRLQWKFDQSVGVRGAAWLAYHLIIALTLPPLLNLNLNLNSNLNINLSEYRGAAWLAYHLFIALTGICLSFATCHWAVSTYNTSSLLVRILSLDYCLLVISQCWH